LKNSKSHKGKKASLETKRKMSISQLGNKNGLGTKRLDIKEMSERQKGCKNSMYGKHHTKETKEKISKMGKGRIAWNKGIPHSKKTKKKISESLKRRKK